MNDYLFKSEIKKKWGLKKVHVLKNFRIIFKMKIWLGFLHLSLVSTVWFFKNGRITNSNPDFFFSFKLCWNVTIKKVFVFCFSFLDYLSWKFKWAFLIDCRPSSVCRSVFLPVCLPSENFSHVRLLLQKHWANFNQTRHKGSLGEELSSLFKWKTTLFSKEI